MVASDSKISLIVGGTGGIGAATARRLAKTGWTTVITGSRSPEAGSEIAKTIPGASYVQADMTAPESSKRVVDAALERFGRLDALVYTAGATAKIPHGDLVAADDAVWNRILDQNVVTIWRTILAAEPHLRKTGGVVVVTGALAGADVGGSSIPYAVSKAGLHHMVKLLAPVLAPEVRINAVAPGLIETPWTSDPAWQPLYEFWEDKAPLKRVGKADDVAEVIDSLIDWNYVTGQTIIIDGGFSLV